MRKHMLYCLIENIVNVKDIHEAINHKCALHLVIDRIKRKIFHIDEKYFLEIENEEELQIR